MPTPSSSAADGASAPEPDPTALVVEIANTQTHLSVDEAALARLARTVLATEGIASASISVALVDDPTIHALNRQHLAHDWPTDVISFVLSDPDERPLVGELVISGQMAVSMAAQLHAEPAGELSLYLVHGLLHLCGYDDLTEADAAVMRQRERFHLERAGIRHAAVASGSAAPESSSPGGEP